MAASNQDCDRIQSYLAKQHVLTVAASEDSQVWCATCFYAFVPEQMSFIIMTDKSTRHGAIMLRNSRVSGTVATQSQIIANIRGFQFSGSASIPEGNDAKNARRQYCRRFPVALASDSTVWRIAIDYGKLTDNTLGFGTKLIWERPIETIFARTPSE